MNKECLTVVTKCEYYKTAHNWYYVCWYDGNDKPADPMHVTPSRGYNVPPVEAYVAVVRDLVTRSSVVLGCNPAFVDRARGAPAGKLPPFKFVSLGR